MVDVIMPILPCMMLVGGVLNSREPEALSSRVSIGSINLYSGSGVVVEYKSSKESESFVLTLISYSKKLGITIYPP
jgi:hypothetical protein